MGNFETTFNGHTSLDSFGDTVLVVEDDDATRELIIGCLTDNQDFNIETASNGLEALVKIAERPTSILKTNINMPKMNGITLLKTLHERGISITTLATSGWWTHETLEKELTENSLTWKRSLSYKNLLYLKI